MTQIRTRFAPSPTGFLHIGNLRTALYGYLYAKKTKGKFVLRIEDTDLERYVEGAVDVILHTLKEAGITYDEGPDIGGPYAPYVQSQRKNDYMKYALQLVEKGSAYYCFCTKERLEGLVDGSGSRKYDKHCMSMSKQEVEQKLQAGEKFVIRQNMPTEGQTAYTDMVFGEIVIENKELEDNILIKSDGMPTYNFANVIDDHTMAINCVMRGMEYLSSTPKYNLLYSAFGWEQPIYVHMPPIMKDATQKLSKRNGDASFADLVKKGFLKEAIVNFIALLGWSPKGNEEKLSLSQLEEMFDIAGISKSPSIFDEVKLRWLNSLYIKELPFDKFLDMTKGIFENSNLKNFDIEKMARLAQSRVETLNEVVDIMAFLGEFEKFDNELYFHKKLKTDKHVAKQVLPVMLQAFEKLQDWSEESVHNCILGVVAQLETKNGMVMWPTRVALSGKASTPGGATELAHLLGKEQTIARMKQSIEWL